MRGFEKPGLNWHFTAATDGAIHSFVSRVRDMGEFAKRLLSCGSTEISGGSIHSCVSHSLGRFK